MKRLLAVFINVFLITHFAQATELFLIHGGTPDSPKSQMFDHDISEWIKLAQSKKWKLNILHNLTKNHFYLRFQNTLNEYGDDHISLTSLQGLELQEYFSTKLNNIAKTSKKVLIIVLAHGVLKTKGQQMHSIQTYPLGTSYNIQSLDPLLNLAQKFNSLQIALIDNSCYSGASIVYDAPLCIMTTSTKETVGFSGYDLSTKYVRSSFSHLIPLKIFSSSNLSDAYLKARRDNKFILLPLINNADYYELQNDFIIPLEDFVLFNSKMHQLLFEASSKSPKDFMQKAFTNADKVRIFIQKNSSKIPPKTAQRFLNSLHLSLNYLKRYSDELIYLQNTSVQILKIIHQLKIPSHLFIGDDIDQFVIDLSLSEPWLPIKQPQLKSSEMQLKLSSLKTIQDLLGEDEIEKIQKSIRYIKHTSLEESGVNANDIAQSSLEIYHYMSQKISKGAPQPCDLFTLD